MSGNWWRGEAGGGTDGGRRTAPEPGVFTMLQALGSGCPREGGASQEGQVGRACGPDLADVLMASSLSTVLRSSHK